MKKTLSALCLALCLKAAAGSAMADQTHPDLPDLFNALLEAGSVSKAGEIEAEIWKRWNEHANGEAKAQVANAEKLWSFGRVVEAIAQLDATVEEFPDFAEAWNRRATYHFLLGSFQKSLEDIDQTLALEPRHFGAMAGAGGIYVRQDNLPKALDYYERATAVHPYMRGMKQRIFQLEKVVGPKI